VRHKVYLAAAGLALGDELPIATAQSYSWITPREVEATDQQAVRVVRRRGHDTNLPGDAALDAIKGSSAARRTVQIGPLYHAATTMHGETAFGATDVMAHLGLPVGQYYHATTILNGNHGVIDALRDAALYLSSEENTSAAYTIVTAGDVWDVPTFQRWAGPMPRGDGAGAFILTDRPTSVRLVASATRTDPMLTKLRRHDGTAADIAHQLDAVLAAVVLDVLGDAGIGSADIRFLVCPFGSDRPEHVAGRSLGKLDDAALARHIDLGRHLGHLGPADLIAGLHTLTQADTPARRGDHILLLADSDGRISVGGSSIGGGSVGAAVFEVLR
jgi:hypothetical protein